MSITLYGNSGLVEEVLFGSHGFRKIVAEGEIVAVADAVGTIFRLDARVRLIFRESPGLSVLPIGATGRISGFDARSRTRYVLRVRFKLRREFVTFSVDPFEIMLLSEL